jgi:hypothetical protein
MLGHQYPGRRGPTIDSVSAATPACMNISKATGEQLLFAYPSGPDILDAHYLGLNMPGDFDKLNELSDSKSPRSLQTARR